MPPARFSLLSANLDQTRNLNQSEEVEQNRMNLKVSVSQLQKHLPEILGGGVGEHLDALGSEYRLACDKQQRTDELLASECLTRAEEKEIETLLKEADEVLLRRAEALKRL